MEPKKLADFEMVFPVVQFFKYEHLPADKQAASKPFGELALHLCNTLPVNGETTKALDLLLAAKDAAVRSSFMK